MPMEVCNFSIFLLTFHNIFSELGTLKPQQRGSTGRRNTYYKLKVLKLK
jgi:hypothetical protein